jgi:hypothetical protein
MTGQGEKVSYPDDIYRELFISTSQNMTENGGITNQNLKFVQDHFQKALKNKNICDFADMVVAKDIWVSNAKNYVWYQKNKVCKFSLMVAIHDSAADTDTGNEGLLVDGSVNSNPMMTMASWFSDSFEVIEHVATQQEPQTISYPHFFDSNIYPGNHTIVDKIGNLTLLSRKVNSSTYSEWPDKIFYFWSLTQPQAAVPGSSQADLAKQLGLKSVPPGLAPLTKASNYLPHLAPLALRGQKGCRWDASFIDKRSENLTTRIFDKLSSWLS